MRDQLLDKLKSRWRWYAPSLALLMALTVSGCFIDLDGLFGSDGDDDAAEHQTTEVSLVLQGRAPAPEVHPAEAGSAEADRPDASAIRAAVVTIAGIYLQGGDSDDAEAADSAGRLWLSREVHTTDLLTLSNDVADLVRDATVQRGSYEQLRFIMTGAYLEVEQADGSTRIYASSPTYEGLPEGVQPDGELQMPSLSTSGLKVNLPDDAFDIDGEQKIVLVEFDVSQSFGHATGTDRWVMHPVLEATDVQFTSTVEVEVTLAAGVTPPTIDGHPLSLRGHRGDAGGFGPGPSSHWADPTGCRTGLRGGLRLRQSAAQPLQHRPGVRPRPGDRERTGGPACGHRVLG